MRECCNCFEVKSIEEFGLYHGTKVKSWICLECDAAFEEE